MRVALIFFCSCLILFFSITPAKAATAYEVLTQYQCSALFTNRVEQDTCKVYWKTRITENKDKWNALKACQASCSGSGGPITCMNTCSKLYDSLDR